MADDLVRAAGIMVCKFDSAKNDYLFLLLKSSNNPFHWTPPKGRLDPGETSIQAAYRETHEESGLVGDQIVLVEGFSETLKYTAHGRNKECTYYLGTLKDPDAKIKLSHEHTDYAWITVEEAPKFCDRESICTMIVNAHNRIKEKLG
ncbi:bifunctional NUDIX hydrolase domain/Bis(5'-nucleosyl)-tetraphosphatase/NUDIX hydrolase [Babesia duncani]|uniref:Bis(5'-nucleosyl)-tetraphosphatase [asymmetrical] n=1 Tax=Babesia duncani TaxID=323732 RepID=A0AAD9PNS2_9APIC|nr:bifunctional NUDIX hydrolase domain/Bis(5'-nucleosyl)-tetraphosphatase/NUDIX hydrolase [Babesia duncani]